MNPVQYPALLVDRAVRVSAADVDEKHASALRRHILGGRKLTTAQALRRAEWLTDISGVMPDLDSRFERGVGRPRELSVRTYLVLCLTTAFLQLDGLITHHREVVAGLTLSQQERLGLRRKGQAFDITYDQFDYVFRLLTDNLRRGWCVLHVHDSYDVDLPLPTAWDSPACPLGCQSDLWRDVDWLVDRLIEWSIPHDIELGTSIALDSTDFETYARRRSWATGSYDFEYDDISPEHGNPRRGKGPFNLPGWPKKGVDGRHQHTTDLEARDGWRSRKNSQPVTIFNGWDVHAVTAAAPRRGGFGVPVVILGLNLQPGGRHRGVAGADLIERVAARRRVTDVVADSAYLFSVPEKFHLRVRAMNIDIVGDVHPKLRGMAPLRPGIVAIDGTPFPAWYPSSFPDRVTLPRAHFNESAEAKRRKTALLDDRATYAFRFHQQHVDGRHRWIGPAQGSRRTIVCANWPQGPVDPALPVTPCKPGDGCQCGATITLGADELARTRQRHPVGSTPWQSDFARRPIVESSYSLLKHHFQKLRREYTYVFGRVKNHFLVGVMAAATNIANAERVRAEHDLPDPWGDDRLELPKTRARPRGRRSGATKTHGDLKNSRGP